VATHLEDFYVGLFQMNLKNVFISFAILTCVTSQAWADSAVGVTHLIERGGRKIAFHVTRGTGETIVLDAGAGEDASYWNSVVPTIAEKTGATIITYDRAGSGGSEEAPGPWSAQDEALDLEAGLTSLQVNSGVVIVAHSLAGEVATYLVLRRPSWVHAAVLLDASIPEFYTDEEIDRQEKSLAPMVSALKHAPTSAQSRQGLAMASSFDAVSRAFHKIAWPSSVPAIVVVSEKTPFEAPEDARAWKAAAHVFVSKTQNRRFMLAVASSHDIAHDDSTVVVDAIRAALAVPANQ
jgi:pimeloyl-ACP methyl ester carboxylesterase